MHEKIDLVKNLETEIFSVLIDRIPIESGKKSWLKIKGFSIGWKSHSINRNSGNLIFLKNCRRLCRNYSNQVISWMKCMRISLKFFKNMSYSNQSFKTRFSILFTPKFSTLEHILYQNHRIYNLRWPNQIHIQFHVLSLAKNNLWSVCN